MIELNEPTQVRINASRWIQHEKWNPDILINDIAVIELSQEAITNCKAVSSSDVTILNRYLILCTANIRFVNLPRRAQLSNSFAGRTARISGWGLDSDGAGNISPVLREVNVGVIGNFICTVQYLGIIRRSHICTSGRGSRGSCSGDSGGPLMINNIQVEDLTPVTEYFLIFF